MKSKTIMDALEKRKATFGEMLPAHVNVDRFMRSAMLAVMRQPKLSDCSVASLVTVVTNAAELGLDFTPAKGHAYIVPYGKEATFMPGYRGLAELARRSGFVIDIDAHVVYKNEYDQGLFKIVYGMNPALSHTPIIVGERGEPIGAYAIAFMKDGTKKPLFMTEEEINKVKKSSPAANSGPWKDWDDEMRKKTAVRRLCKLLPSSPDLDKAIAFDNHAVGLKDEGITPGGSRTDALADMIGANTPDDAEYEDIPTEGDGTLFDKDKKAEPDDGMPFGK